MSLMKTRNPSKSLTTCPTMNKIVHFPGISHAFPGISHAQIPGYSQVFAVPRCARWEEARPPRSPRHPLCDFSQCSGGWRNWIYICGILILLILIVYIYNIYIYTSGERVDIPMTMIMIVYIIWNIMVICSRLVYIYIYIYGFMILWYLMIQPRALSCFSCILIWCCCLVLKRRSGWCFLIVMVTS